MKKLNVILSIITIGIMMSSCKKDAVETSPTSTYPYQIRLTDAPGPYNAVYIDLQGLEITGNDGKAVLLDLHWGIYNLLNFTNGKDTLIASGTLKDTTVKQIRLILGANNSVVVNNVSFPLSTPSDDQSGLKLQMNQTLTAGALYSVLLDFDANKSIVDEGNGNYKLKPVIRTIVTDLTGAIKGNISPAGTLAFVTSTSTISYCSNVNTTGDFKVIGLLPGTYTVIVTPAFPLIPVTLNNIIVTAGFTTNLGAIILQ